MTIRALIRKAPPFLPRPGQGPASGLPLKGGTENVPPQAAEGSGLTPFLTGARHPAACLLLSALAFATLGVAVLALRHGVPG